MSNSDLAKRYIGKQISLISTSYVRYEGYLYTIDEQAQTVALQNVVCMGTEGRRHGDQAIGPSDTTYEFIIFRGVNIQHFYVKSDESLGKPTVDKTQELFAALGIDDDEALYGGGRDYRGSGSRNKERPSSRLIPLDDTPKRRVGRGDFSPRDNYHPQYQPRYPPRDWDRYPNYPRGGGYARGPMPRRRDRDRRRYDDGGYDRPPQRRGGPDPDRQRGDGRRRGGSGRSPNRMNGGNQGRRQSSRRNNNNRGRGDNYNNNNRRDRQNSNRQSNRQSGGSGGGGGGGQTGGNAGGKRKQAGTGEFLTKAGRGEELEINENQLFDFEEAKTKFTRAADVEVKAGGDDMGEIKASAEVENTEVENTEAADDQKISEMSEVVDMGGQELSATDDVNCYDPTNSFFDSLSTDNAQRSKTGRPDMNEQRNVDAKTFGSIAQTYKSSHLRSAGGNRGDKSRNRRPNNQKPKRNRRRTNERSRRQRAPPVQRQWQPRQY